MSIPAETLEQHPSLRKIIEQGDDYQEWNDGREKALLDYIKQRPDVDSFRDHADALLAAMDQFASQHDFLINIGPDKGCILSDLIASEKPLIYVELGGYLGYSAIVAAGTMRRALPQTSKPRVWSLEFDPTFAAIARELVAVAGLDEIVTVVTGAADMLLIDHGEGGIHLYQQDLMICEELKLLKSGACIVADNVLRPGAPDYRKYVRSQPNYQSTGVTALIMPGGFEDEFEVTKVL